MSKSKKHHDARVRRRIYRANTNKIIDKLVRNVSKVGSNKHRRAYLETKSIKEKEAPQPGKLKFGSINVDGMDEETNAAIKNLILSRDFDVSYIKCKK